jgi:hypothetical protein
MVKTVFNICQQLLQPRGAYAAVVLAASVAIASLGCSKADDHVAVYPVKGKIQYQGKPINGAFVTLQPKAAVEGVPGPRATVAADGTFEVSTFNGGDGAPEGDYTLTVQWYKAIVRDHELIGGPNALPAKYASPKTSGLLVSVAAGENLLKPIVLR